MKKFAYSNTGPRKLNEDHFDFEQLLDDSEFFCIADGVGGNSCGEYASRFSIETFINKIKSVTSNERNLTSILKYVHHSLISESLKKPQCKGMATTFTGLLTKNNHAQIIHTGDSRAYLLRGNGLRQLTEDHTESKRLRKEGLLTYEQSLDYIRKNILDSALGIEGELIITDYSFDCTLQDRIILATDGFYNVFTKIEIRDLSISNDDFDSFCEKLKYNLDLKSLKDNATFLVVEVS